MPTRRPLIRLVGCGFRFIDWVDLNGLSLDDDSLEMLLEPRGARHTWSATTSGA
jgi:hypothetical protein